MAHETHDFRHHRELIRNNLWLNDLQIFCGANFESFEGVIDYLSRLEVVLAGSSIPVRYISRREQPRGLKIIQTLSRKLVCSRAVRGFVMCHENEKAMVDIRWIDMGTLERQVVKLMSSLLQYSRR
jgi:hypothetical protein